MQHINLLPSIHISKQSQGFLYSVIFKLFLHTIDIYYFKSSVHFIYVFLNLLDKCHCKNVCSAVHKRSQLTIVYDLILLALSIAVTTPTVIEFVLFSLHPLQTLTLDFIEENGIWKVGDAGRRLLFFTLST